MSQSDRRRDHRLEQVTQVLRTLPAEQAEVIALRIFCGMSVAEVGRIMGKNEAVVKLLLHRAVCELRRLLWSQETKA
jgi:RNA polymerase sigma-70 factor (ECF subfamily)